MKKQILNLGKALTKVEQKTIKGGGMIRVSCSTNRSCPSGQKCCTHSGGYSCFMDDPRLNRLTCRTD